MDIQDKKTAPKPNKWLWRLIEVVLVLTILGLLLFIPVSRS